MKKIIIMGAAGRDFHNFNVCFKNNPSVKVVCFTAAQIPNIAKRKYPPSLAGSYYPQGIPIYPEESLPNIIKKFHIDEVILSYSDLSYQEVMHKASLVNAKGASFTLLPPKETMLQSKKPIIAVTAVRTGCGKSQTTRYIARYFKSCGKKSIIVRHPMPYGDLSKQEVQRFATFADLSEHNTTIEEREEYEPLIEQGFIVYAGIDYQKILNQAEKEADIIIWDGGNNDTPFFKPNLWITIADPYRAGHEISYYPGETNFRSADIIIINKETSALKENIQKIKQNAKQFNPKAFIIDAESMITVSKPIKNKKVLIIEDGPTLTHGGMAFGAGTIAARRSHVKIIDPRPYLTPALREVFRKYSHLGSILPAMGYDRSQIKDLETVINKVPCDIVISGTPIDLRKVLSTKKQLVRIRYELKEKTPALESFLKKVTISK